MSTGEDERDGGSDGTGDGAGGGAGDGLSVVTPSRLWCEKRLCIAPFSRSKTSIQTLSKIDRLGTNICESPQMRDILVCRHAIKADSVQNDGQAMREILRQALIALVEVHNEGITHRYVTRQPTKQDSMSKQEA